MEKHPQFSFDDKSDADSIELLQDHEQELLLSILDQYMADWEAGVPVDEDSIIAKHPSLASALRVHFNNIRMLHGAALQLGKSDPLTGDSFAPGATRRLGEFEIRREIGRGGMGIVYEAVQESLGRRVALKVLPFAAVLDQKQIARFNREAQTAGQLDHPNIVPVHAVGCERGVHFYSMRLIDGQSLDIVLSELRSTSDDTKTEEYHGRDSLRSEADVTPQCEPDGQSRASVSTWDRFSTTGDHKNRDYIRAIAKLGTQAAAALQHAHEFGVVHRDIKPSNLILDTNGHLWVTDFGLAHIQSDVELTQSGNLIGTLKYMSPEQAAGSVAIDQRADVYSLGITLYELLTLQPAVRGTNREKITEQISNEDPISVRRLNPSISVDLETIILKATAKARDDRYATALDFQNDLQRFLDGKPTLARRPTMFDRAIKWSNRHKSVVAAVATVLLLAFVGSVATTFLVAAEQRRTQAALNAKQHQLERASKYFHQAQRVVDSLAVDMAQNLSRVSGTEPIRRELLEQARAYYIAFCEDAEREFRLHGDDQLKESLATTHHRLGRINHHMGRHAESEDSYRRAVALYSKLNSESQNARYATDVATNLNGLALSLHKQGHASEAEEHYRTAISIYRQFTDSDNTNAQNHRKLASAYVNLAAMFEERNETEHAIELVERARRQCVAAIELAPESESSQHRLAWCLHNLSYMLRNTDADLAAQYSLQAIEVQQALLDKHPNATVLRSELALSYSNYGALQSRQGDDEAAAKSFRSAVQLGKQVVARAPNIATYRRELVVAINYLGTCLKHAERLAEANQQFAEARQLVEEDFDADSSALQTRATLAGICNNQGMIAHLQGQHGLAAKRYAEAIEYLEDIESTRLGPEHESILATARQNLKKLLQHETATIQHTTSIVRNRPQRTKQP